MIHEILREMERLGHSWKIASGPRRQSGDVALLHVNATIVPADYLGLAENFPVKVNFAVADISKRHVSDAVLDGPGQWSGPVVVKTNLNAFGVPEARINRHAARRGLPPPFQGARMLADYRIAASASEIGDDVWNDPQLVVERFVPEIEERGYVLRNWVFFGANERCTRHVADAPIVKGANVFASEPCAVPERLRRRRAELGFDYGKFDFVMHEGEAVLLDANRTPANALALRDHLRSGTRNLADGFDRLIRERLAL